MRGALADVACSFTAVATASGATGFLVGASRLTFRLAGVGIRDVLIDVNPTLPDPTDPTRTRKLLLNKRELAQILEATSQKGQTCVCTQLYWKGHLVKARLALAVGKQSHDKRDTEKQRDWQRDKARIVRDNVKQ